VMLIEILEDVAFGSSVVFLVSFFSLFFLR